MSARARWVLGRRELFSALPDELVRLDPRERAAAGFVDALRELDRIHWCEPLGRVRPSWVFYDCALVPGVMCGFADEHGAPCSFLALIPTLDGAHLVQALAAPDDALAHATLHLGIELFAPSRLVVALPWSSPFLARFLALGPLRVRTAWTPAHDLPSTVTFDVAPDPVRPPRRQVGEGGQRAESSGKNPTDVTHPLMPGDRASEQLLQLELELGVAVELRALSPEGPLLSGWRRH